MLSLRNLALAVLLIEQAKSKGLEIVIQDDTMTNPKITNVHDIELACDPPMDGRAHAARLATGKAGGVPLANLSRATKAGLKNPIKAQGTPSSPAREQAGGKAAQRRLKQLMKQQERIADCVQPLYCQQNAPEDFFNRTNCKDCDRK